MNLRTVEEFHIHIKSPGPHARNTTYSPNLLRCIYQNKSGDAVLCQNWQIYFLKHEMEILVSFIFAGKLVVSWARCSHLGDIYELSVSYYKSSTLLKWIYYRVTALHSSSFAKCCQCFNLSRIPITCREKALVLRYLIINEQTK